MYRYQKIESKIWHDEKFKKLSDDAKILFLYFLTSPHSNILGAYVLPKEYIIADLKWSSKRLSKPFAELLKSELCFYENSTELLLVANHLKHNPIENPNQAKSAAKSLNDLPKSSIFQYLKLLDKPFLKPLTELLNKQFAKPEEGEGAEESTETGTEEYSASQKKSGTLYGSDEDFINKLKTLPCYSGINIDHELSKMDAWLLTPKGKGRQKTRKFIVNWLNKIDKPVTTEDHRYDFLNDIQKTN